MHGPLDHYVDSLRSFPHDDVENLGNLVVVADPCVGLQWDKHIGLSLRQTAAYCFFFIKNGAARRQPLGLLITKYYRNLDSTAFQLATFNLDSNVGMGKGRPPPGANLPPGGH